MFYILLLFIQSIFASTSEVLSRPYTKTDQDTPPSHAVNCTSSSQTDTARPNSTTIVHSSMLPIRNAWWLISDEPAYTNGRQTTPPKSHNTYQSFLLEEAILNSTANHAEELLTLPFYPAQCQTIDNVEFWELMWQENQQSTQTFQIIEAQLKDQDNPAVKRLLSQLHAVGTLALVGLSQTMHAELSQLFTSILDELQALNANVTQITIPDKKYFIDTTHSGCLPWKSINYFSCYTRWLIKYRQNLQPKDDSNIAKLHTIVTKQINSFLSPRWDVPTPEEGELFPSPEFYAEWSSTSGVSDNAIEEFVAFASTQSSDDCKILQIMDAYEKAAIGWLNARQCRMHFNSYKRPIEWAFAPMRKANSPATREELRQLLELAKPMLTVHMPVSYTTTAPYLLRNPQESYQRTVQFPLHGALRAPLPPKQTIFLPGSEHLAHAKKWHANVARVLRAAGGELHPSDPSGTIECTDLSDYDLCPEFPPHQEVNASQQTSPLEDSSNPEANDAQCIIQ